MPSPDGNADPVATLAQLIVAAAGQPEAPKCGLDERLVQSLIARLSEDSEGGQIDRFFALVARGLASSGARLPPLEALPASLGPFLADMDVALAAEDQGEADFEAVARGLDRSLETHFGVSPRKAREQAIRDRIRREVSEKVARSLRRHGLRPACDSDDDDAAD